MNKKNERVILDNKNVTVKEYFKELKIKLNESVIFRYKKDDSKYDQFFMVHSDKSVRGFFDTGSENDVMKKFNDHKIVEVFIMYYGDYRRITIWLYKTNDPEFEFKYGYEDNDPWT